MATNSVFPWCVQDTRRGLNETGAQYLEFLFQVWFWKGFFYIYIRWHITVTSTILCPHLLLIYTCSTLSCLYALLGVVLRLYLWNFMPAFYIDPNPYGFQDKKKKGGGAIFVSDLFALFSFNSFKKKSFLKYLIRFVVVLTVCKIWEGQHSNFYFKSMSYFLWIIMIWLQEEALVIPSNEVAMGYSNATVLP